MTAERRVARNTAWLVLQPLLMNVLSLAATAYITRRLGAVEFGRFNLGIAFVAMLAPLSNLGIRSLTVRHVAQNRETASDYLGKVLVLSSMLSAMTAAIILVAAPLSGGTGATRVVIAISAVGLIATTGARVFTDGFHGFEMMRPASIAHCVGGIVLTIASVVVVKCGGGIGSMALAYAVGPVCSLSLLILWSRRALRPRLCFDPGAFKEILQRALPFSGITILAAISSRIDVILLARMLGESRLGAYTAAMALVERGLMLSDGAATALLPAVANLCTHDRASATALLRRSILVLLLIALPAAILISIFSPVIVAIVFGPQYAAAARILAVGIWQLPAMCLAELSGHSLFAVGRQGQVLRTDAIAMAISITLIVPLIHAMGPVGGAVALALRPLIAALLRIPATLHHFPNLWPWRQFARLTAALALMLVPLSYVPNCGPGLKPLMLAPLAVLFYALGLTVMRVDPALACLRYLNRRTLGGSVE